MSRRRTSIAALEALRERMTGAAMRTIAGIRDFGETVLARVENVDGGDHLDTDGDADVWVHYTEAVSRTPGIARLFVPGNILFALPLASDTAMLLRGRDSGGPGAPYLLHGDAGDASRIPNWIRQKVGVFVKDKVLRLESKTQDVEIAVNDTVRILVRQSGRIEITSSGSEDIVLNGGSARVARVGDATSGHQHASGTMTAGPWPVVGLTAQATDTINAGAARVRA